MNWLDKYKDGGDLPLMGGGGGGGDDLLPVTKESKSNISERERQLLDFIGQYESRGGDYDILYSGYKGKPDKPITEMTLAEVQELQKLMQSSGSSAVGAHQFIYKSLAEEIKLQKLDKNTLFTKEVQDNIILNRLKRKRGFDKFLEGELTPDKFALNLSKEFASLPNPRTGRSYYDKDGLNKSLVDKDTYLNTLSSIQSHDDGIEPEYDEVYYGTPEYKKAYDEGRFVSHLNPLKEVVINSTKRPVGPQKEPKPTGIPIDISSMRQGEEPLFRKGGKINNNKNWLDKYEVASNGSKFKYSEGGYISGDPKKKIITVSSKDDPRYKAYKDSLYNYNLSQEHLKLAKGKGFTEVISPRETGVPKVGGPEERMLQRMYDADREMVNSETLPSFLIKNGYKANYPFSKDKTVHRPIDTYNSHNLKEHGVVSRIANMWGIKSDLNDIGYTVPIMAEPEEEVRVVEPRNETDMQMQKIIAPIRYNPKVSTNSNMTPEGLASSQEDITSDIFHPLANIPPKYWDVIQETNQGLGSSKTRRRVHDFNELLKYENKQNVDAQTSTGSDNRLSVTPRYAEGGVLEDPPIPNIVQYGTPEYEQAYKDGTFVSHDNPLDEVIITADKRTGKNILEDYPYYYDLTKEELKYFRDNSPIGVAIRRKAQTKKGLAEDALAIPGQLLQGAMESLQTPQSLMIEGAQAIEGKPYNFMDALPGSNAQRTTSDVYGFETTDDMSWYNPKNISNFALDVVTDPLDLLGVGIAGDAVKIGRGVNKLGNRYLPNAHKLNPYAFRTSPENFYRQVDNVTYNEGLESGLIRGKQAVDRTTGEEIVNLNKYFGDDAYYNKGSLYYKNNKDLPYLFEAKLGEDKFIPKVNGRTRKYTTENTSVRVSKEPLPINDPNITTYKKDWLKGYKKVPNNKVLNKTDDVAKTATSSVDDVNRSVKPAWQLEELPGLHLKSTMEGEAISKIVDKTGKINTEQALAIIGKESGGADKVALIKQGLGENIPKKMDYNDFRKTVQDQLIPLETKINPMGRSEYGLQHIGYDDAPPMDMGALTFSNKSKFGRGSSAHGNPEETLGHAHFLRDAETPDVLTVTQIQSDAFQGTNRTMPKSIEGAKEKIKQSQEWIDYTVENFGDEAEKFDDVFKRVNNDLKMDKTTLDNFTQKQLLDKNHQERYLQELVDYAGKRGDINKVRVPTSETAAKVQGYKKSAAIDGKFNEEASEVISAIDNLETFKLSAKGDDLIEINKELKKLNEKIKSFSLGYSPEDQTILKKYKDNPKTIKKLFGVEPKVVTDGKGNTWYEFDIPKKFKEGKGEIKALGLIPLATGIEAATPSQNQNTEYPMMRKGGILASNNWLNKYEEDCPSCEQDNASKGTTKWLTKYEEGGSIEPMSDAPLDMQDPPVGKQPYNREQYLEAFSGLHDYLKKTNYASPYYNDGHINTQHRGMNCINGVCGLVSGLTDGNVLPKTYTGNMNFESGSRDEGFYKFNPQEDGFEPGDTIQYARYKGSLGSRFDGKVTAKNTYDLVGNHSVMIADKYEKDGQTFYTLLNNGGGNKWSVSNELTEEELFRRYYKGYSPRGQLKFDGAIGFRYDPEKVAEQDLQKKENDKIMSGKNDYNREYANAKFDDKLVINSDSSFAFTEKGRPTQYSKDFNRFIPIIEKSYNTLGRGSNIPKKVYDELALAQIGIMGQESKYGTDPRVELKETVPGALLPTARDWSDKLSSTEDDWKKHYYKNNYNNVQEDYKSLTEFKKSFKKKYDLPEDVQKHLLLNSPKSIGSWQQKNISKRGSYYNLDKKGTTNQFLSSLALSIDNYHEMKKMYPEASEKELIDLTIMMHNSPGKAKEDLYKDAYIDKDDAGYVQSVRNYTPIRKSSNPEEYEKQLKARQEYNDNADKKFEREKIRVQSPVGFKM